MRGAKVGAGRAIGLTGGGADGDAPAGTTGAGFTACVGALAAFTGWNEPSGRADVAGGAVKEAAGKAGAAGTTGGTIGADTTGADTGAVPGTLRQAASSIVIFSK